MKKFFIISNVAAALAFAFLTPVPLKARRAKALAAYQEFQSEHVLVERPTYDIEQKLRMLAGDNNLQILGFRCAAIACGANAAAFYWFLKRESV